MLRINEITSELEFRTLQSDWDNLLRTMNDPSPFLNHDWFKCCLASYSSWNDMLILSISDGSHIIGIVPFRKSRETVRGIKIRMVEFISCPDTPFVDFVIEDSRRREVLQAVLMYLLQERRNIWDVLKLNYWPVDSQNNGIVKEILRKYQKRFYECSSSKTPYIVINREWQAYLQTLSLRFKKTHRNIVNKIEKLKGEVECFRHGNVGRVLEDIVSISEKSWKHKEGIAIPSKNESKKFFSMLTEVAEKQGWLMVWMLKINGAPIAMEYDLEYQKKVYALRADFDEKYKEYSPGSYLEYQIVKYLFENGYSEYSTGPGLNTYKLRWTGQLKENVSLQVCNNNVKGQVVWGLEKRIIPLLRPVKE